MKRPIFANVIFYKKLINFYSGLNFQKNMISHYQLTLLAYFKNMFPIERI